jgi:hypothetical protein
VPVPVVSAAQHPALAAAGTRSREEGEKMRELGVRNSLHTEGAAWARAPGQRHRDRNVTSDIFLSVKPPSQPNPPDPRSGAIVTGYQRRSSCPCTCSPQRHTRAVGARSGRYEGMVPPPSLPQQKKRSRHQCNHHHQEPMQLQPAPGDNPKPKQLIRQADVIQSAQQPSSRPFFPPLPPRPPLPHDSAGSAMAGSPWASAPVWEKKVPRAGVHPTLVQAKCDAI